MCQSEELQEVTTHYHTAAEIPDKEFAGPFSNLGMLHEATALSTLLRPTAGDSLLLLVQMAKRSCT